MTDIYQLSESQYDTMVELAHANQVLMAAGALDTDDEETIAGIDSKAVEIGDLVYLGLLEDKSAQFEKQIRAFAEKYGRTFHIYTISDIGFKMFYMSQTRKDN